MDENERESFQSQSTTSTAPEYKWSPCDSDSNFSFPSFRRQPLKVKPFFRRTNLPLYHRLALMIISHIFVNFVLWDSIFWQKGTLELLGWLKLHSGGCWEATHLQWLSFPKKRLVISKRWMPRVTFAFVLCNTSWVESSEVDAWHGTQPARRRIWLSCGAAQLWTSPGDTMCTHRNIQAAPPCGKI